MRESSTLGGSNHLPGLEGKLQMKVVQTRSSIMLNHSHWYTSITLVYVNLMCVQVVSFFLNFQSDLARWTFEMIHVKSVYLKKL